jgi:hypothetical protein
MERRTIAVMTIAVILMSALGMGLVLTAAPLLAHHGTAASYDQGKWINVTGVVTQFIWRNPHSSLYLDTTENGKASSYSVEMASPGLLVQEGYTKQTFQAGDKVTIRVHPSLAGTAVGECLFSCQVTINGKVLRTGRGGNRG